MAEKKWYVVWQGRQPGIYDSWDKAQKQISGFAGAKFRSFKSRALAEKAFKDPGSVPAASKKKKTMYYVVWSGHQPGIYTNWEEAKAQITGAQKPIYKTFGSKELAEKAYNDHPDNYMGRGFKKTRDLTPEEKARIGDPIELSLCVDAACNGKTGEFEYRGVWTYSGEEVFRVGPYPDGTNNIGEFLALVHALAFLKELGLHDFPIYSDSRNAMGWVDRLSVRTTAKNPKTVQLLHRGLNWLKSNTYKNPILKWETKAWGEIPADFGRK